MSQSPGCSLGTAPGMMMGLGVFDRGFDRYSGRVGTGDMVSTNSCSQKVKAIVEARPPQLDQAFNCTYVQGF